MADRLVSYRLHSPFSYLPEIRAQLLQPANNINWCPVSGPQDRLFQPDLFCNIELVFVTRSLIDNMTDMAKSQRGNSNQRSADLPQPSWLNIVAARRVRLCARISTSNLYDSTPMYIWWATQRIHVMKLAIVASVCVCFSPWHGSDPDVGLMKSLEANVVRLCTFFNPIPLFLANMRSRSKVSIVNYSTTALLESS